jgi:hypothetical protein
VGFCANSAGMKKVVLDTQCAAKAFYGNRAKGMTWTKSFWSGDLSQDQD